MKTALLIIVAACLAGQAWIVTGQGLHSEFGIVALGLLALIEALVAVVWMTTARHDFDMARRQEEHEEEQAEIGQTSRLPEMRGRSISKHIRATGDRLRIMERTVLGTVLPMLIVAALGIAAAMWLADIALAVR